MINKMTKELHTFANVVYPMFKGKTCSIREINNTLLDPFGQRTYQSYCRKQSFCTIFEENRSSKLKQLKTHLNRVLGTKFGANFTVPSLDLTPMVV